MWKKWFESCANTLKMKNRETLLIRLWQQQLRRQGLFKDNGTSLAHHHFSISIRLDRKRRCVAIFRSLRNQV